MCRLSKFNFFLKKLCSGNHVDEILFFSIYVQFSRMIVDVIFQKKNLIEFYLYFYENYLNIVEELSLTNPYTRLPSLKKLHLANLYLNNALISQILIRCPLLNGLSLENYVIDTIEIRSNTIGRWYLHSIFYIVFANIISTPDAPRTLTWHHCF